MSCNYAKRTLTVPTATRKWEWKGWIVGRLLYTAELLIDLDSVRIRQGALSVEADTLVEIDSQRIRRGVVEIPSQVWQEINSYRLRRGEGEVAIQCLFESWASVIRLAGMEVLEEQSASEYDPSKYQINHHYQTSASEPYLTSEGQLYLLKESTFPTRLGQIGWAIMLGVSFDGLKKLTTRYYGESSQPLLSFFGVEGKSTRRAVLEQVQNSAQEAWASVVRLGDWESFSQAWSVMEVLRTRRAEVDLGEDGSTMEIGASATHRTGITSAFASTATHEAYAYSQGGYLLPSGELYHTSENQKYLLRK